jgi:PAS domain S-box-containing protein
MLEDLTGRFRRPGHIETMAHPLRKIFEYAVPGLAVFDPDGSVLDCNASFAAMTGRSREELQHTDSFSFVHPDDRERSRSDLNRLLEGQSPAFVIEKRLVRPDASIVWVRNSVSLIRDAENKPLQIVTIAEDMTMFRLAEQALIKNEKLAAVGRLSASIAHELNNPLESIINLLFLISHGSDVAEMQHFAELAEQEMRRVAQIATQTLRFYRQQSAPAALHLGEVIDSVLALFEGRLYQRNVRVVKRFVRCDQLMIAYSGELRQVFVNLVSNALDAMNDHGVLHIDVRPSRNWQGGGEPGMRVLVCDSGSGIPRQMLQKIFEPFVSTKENQGTGLGLWISREIIRRHGGVLRVRSQVSGPRRGTAMSVFLPFPASDKSAILAA